MRSRETPAGSEASSGLLLIFLLLNSPMNSQVCTWHELYARHSLGVREHSLGVRMSMEIKGWGETQANCTPGPASTASSIPPGLSSLQRHSPIRSGPLSLGRADGQPRADKGGVSSEEGMPLPVWHKDPSCLSASGPQLWRPTAPPDFHQPGLSTAVCQVPARLSGQTTQNGSLCLAQRWPRRCLEAAATGAGLYTPKACGCSASLLASHSKPSKWPFH